MDMPTMPPPPRPALVLNISLPMVKGGEIIPQPLWMESQLKDYAQQARAQERARCRDLVRRYMPVGWAALYDAIEDQP
jgi:hypothetical protein